MATNDKAGSLHIIEKETSSLKHEIDINKCKPGMQIAETIHNDQGVVIIVEKTVLSPSTIQRLESLGYNKVKVFIPSVNAKSSTSSYEALYQSCLNNVNSIYDTIQSGKKLKAELIVDATKVVCESSMSGSDFFQQTYRLMPESGTLQIHCLNTAMLAAYLHKWMQCDHVELNIVVEAALLHDIGKTKLSEQYHYESPNFTEKEKKLHQIHPRLGWEMVSKIKGIPPRVSTIVDMHHENDDGSGFPMKLKRSNIDPLARIVSVASRFDTLTTGTNQTRSVSPFIAFEKLEADARSGINVEEILCFLNQVPNYYVGDRFFLSNGEIAEIVYINPQYVSRPLVKVGSMFIDLSLEKNIDIAGMV